MESDRRRSPRGWTKLWVAIEGTDAELRPRSGNVSATGVFFEYDRPVGVSGTVQWLYLSSADRIVSVQIMACVVRCMPLPSRSDAGPRSYGVALEFMPESDEAITQLRDFLHYVLALAADGVRAHDARGVGAQAGVKSITFETDWQLPVGAPIRVAIITRDQPRTVRVEGRVVKRLAAEGAKGQRIEIAVQRELQGPLKRFSAIALPAVTPKTEVAGRSRRYTPAYGIPFAKDADFDADARDREDAMNEALEGLLGTLLEVRDQPKGSTRSHLSGELARIKLPTLLQVIEMDGMTGELLLRRGETSRTLYFVSGRLVDVAPAVDVRGELRTVFSWPDGAFDFTVAPVTRADRVATSTMGLLLDLAREADEAAREAEGD